MFGLWRRMREGEDRLRKLESQLEQIRDTLRELDVGELERMRGSVLNALRALRRSQSAQDARSGNGEGSSKGGDDIDRLLALRRGK